MAAAYGGVKAAVTGRETIVQLYSVPRPRLKQQFASAAAFPERRGNRPWDGVRDFVCLREDRVVVRHGRSSPRSSTVAMRAPAPPLLHNAT
jgi:hypothetical protein